MRVTAVEPQKKRGRFNIYVDGLFFCGISASTLARYNLYENKDLTQDECDDIFRQELLGRVYDRCVGKLAVRPQSIREMERYVTQLLRKKRAEWFRKTQYEAQAEQIEHELRASVIERLQSEKLLSDKEFARWWVEQRVRHSFRGWAIIQSELRSKGVSDDIILGSKIAGQDEKTAAKRAYEKYCTRASVTRDQCIRRLLSRGFDWDIIRGLVGDIDEEHNDAS